MGREVLLLDLVEQPARGSDLTRAQSGTSGEQAQASLLVAAHAVAGLVERRRNVEFVQLFVARRERLPTFDVERLDHHQQPEGSGCFEVIAARKQFVTDR